MKTRITELLNIKYPIVQGGMHYVGFAELAAAVSEAGGLGTITALTQPSPEKLWEEIEKCKKLTKKPIAVNLTFLPSLANPDYPAFIDVIIDSGIKIVETAGRNPEPYVPQLKSAGIKIIHKCTSVRHALKAQKIGLDSVSVDGFECGGHPGEDDVPNMILIPRAAEELKIPIIASGGISDGRSLVAALSLGADAVNMGTRMMMTKESPAHKNVKEAILKATELDTALIMRNLQNTERVLKNPAVDKVLAIEHQKGRNINFDDIAKEVVGVYPRVMIDGESDSGAWSCGMVAGLINDIPSVKELIDRTIMEAHHIIKNRLNQFGS